MQIRYDRNMSLIYFYGNECEHCERMNTLVDRFMIENQIAIIRKEVWHNKENDAEMQAIDCDRCGGIPFFWNGNTKKWLCGEVSYNDIKEWAEGK